MGLHQECREVTIRQVKCIDECFDDVIGQDEAVEAMKRFSNMINFSDLAQYYEVEIPSAYLMHGPPGTGKTMLTKAFSKETNAVFIPISCTDFGSKYVNQSSKNLEAIFQKAASYMTIYHSHEEAGPEPYAKRVVLFFDEADSMFRNRQGTDNSSEDDKVVNVMNERLDGYKHDSRMTVVLATNFPESLDTALKTRCHQINFDEFSIDDLELLYYSKLSKINKKKYSISIKDYGELAHLSKGFNGRDVNQVIQLAREEEFNRLLHTSANQIVKNYKLKITQEELKFAIGKVKNCNYKQKLRIGFTGH